jgi:nucleotide-binding universal stress UspA family protein
MIENVLIAVENNRDRMVPVVEHAAEIADALSAKVTLYHVYEPKEFESLLDSRDLDSGDPSVLARDNDMVETAAELLQEAGVSFKVAADTGDPAEEIVSFVKANDIDHVFVGGRRRSPAGKVILGSVSQTVLIETEVPCTIIM